MSNRTRLQMRLGALAVVGASLVGPAVLADTSQTSVTFLVETTINQGCILIAGTASTLEFGTYDPLGANASTSPSGALSTSGSVLKYGCSTGTANPVITLDLGQHASSGQRRLLPGSGTGSLNYNLYSDSAHSKPWDLTHTPAVTDLQIDGQTHDLTVYGVIAGGQNMPAGTYQDTITATVTF